MSGSPEPNPQPEPDALEIATDQAIGALRDGDLRATVQALIVANGLLEAELRVYVAASKGYARGGGNMKWWD